MESSREALPADQSLKRLVSTRGTVLLGYFVSALFVLTFAVWGGSVPLTSAAIASGVVGVEGHKKLIQHLEGGIVQQIHVKDGDIVSEGELLVSLNDVSNRTEYDELKHRYILTSVEHARSLAEQNSRNTVELPEWLAEEDQATVDDAMVAQSEILAARLSTFEQSRTNLVHKLKESEQEVAAARTRIKNLEQKKSLIQNELVEFDQLRKNGLATRSQLFDLQKQLTDIELDVGESRSAISLAKQRSSQYTAQMAELNSTRISRSAEEAALTHKELTSLRQQLVSAKSMLERSNVYAPISGYVINSVVNTVGGVIPPRQTIMEILPTDEKLLINGRVPPKDRDSIRVGQRAEVRFSAFSRRTSLPVEGVVKLISADSVVDPITSLPYYSTTIELSADPSDALNGEAIFPGMQADILIITGAQTFLQYLASPITRSFNRAFRES